MDTWDEEQCAQRHGPPLVGRDSCRRWVLRDIWRGAARPGYPARDSKTGAVLTHARFRAPLGFKERAVPLGQRCRHIKANWIVISFLVPRERSARAFVDLVLASFTPRGYCTRQELAQAFAMLSGFPL
ncbi:MAG: hypothetical protein KGJ13_09870 [Patescibacteria group bacterium]|nr:hypothetical protein [Patescibacteria group bacterium]